jgi:hypothetical protein
LKIGLEEIGKVVLKISFGFPCCFFRCVMVPLNLIHFGGLSSGTSFFSVKDSDGMFRISQIWFDFDSLGIDDLGGDLNTLSELRYMKDVMDGR